MGSREDMLERALEESRRSLAEVVDEVVHVEKELSKYKASCQRLQERVRELEANENGSGNDHTNAIRSLKQMLADQQELFTSQKREIAERADQKVKEAEKRVKEMEKLAPRGVGGRAENAIAEERSLREDLERTLQTVMQERDAARNELLAWSMKSNLSKEENKTLEDQYRLMREEFERAQRNAEGAVREQRASEKRFEALAEEMRQVMEERDAAFAARDEARRQKADEERLAKEARQQANEALAMNAVLSDRLTSAERARDAALSGKQSEERLRSQAEADIEVLRQQAHTLQVERDAALRENESVLERLDQAIGARRLAVAAKAEAVKQAEDAVKKAEQAEQRMRTEQKRADEVESKLREAVQEINQLQERVAEQGKELREAHDAVQEYRELKEEAERECEAARRQVRGLNEEMLSVLKARDLALQQRDDAFSKQRPQLLEDARGIRPLTASSSDVQQQQQQWIKDMDELRMILRAASVALQDDSSPSRITPPPPPATSDTDLGAFIRTVKAEAGDLSLKVGAFKEKVQRAMHGQREAARRTESQLEPLTRELQDLRIRAAETEQQLKQATGGTGSTSNSPAAGAETLRRELRDRIAECEALREERKALYLEVKELTFQLSRATPQRREVDTLKEKLRQVLNDFDRVEAENRRLKGL